MYRIVFLAATLISLVGLPGSFAAMGAELQYSLACKSLWTKFNDAPLTIQTYPFSDIYFIDLAKNTINGAAGEFTDTEISWEETGANSSRALHRANRITGQYTVSTRSVNPIDGSQVTTQYEGACEHYDPLATGR